MKFSFSPPKTKHPDCIQQARFIRLSILVLICGLIITQSATASAIEQPKWVSDREWSNPSVYQGTKTFLSSEFTNKKSGKIKDGLLRCRLRVSEERRYDQYGRPDLSLAISIGKYQSLTFHEHDGKSTAWFNSRITSLSPMEMIHIEVQDRDVFSNDKIGHIEVAYLGNSVISNETDLMDIRCLVLNAAMVKKAELAEQKAFFKQVVESRKHLVVQQKEPHFGRLVTKMPDMEDKIIGLAALVGWSSQSVQDALQRYANMETLWQTKVKKVQSDILLHQAVKKGIFVPIRNTALKASVQSWECGDSVIGKYQRYLHGSGEEALLKSHCVVKINIKNIGQSIELTQFSNWYGGSPYDLFAVDDYGEYIPLESLGFPQGNGRNFLDEMMLKTNATTTIIFALTASAKNIVFVRIQQSIDREKYALLAAVQKQ